jgi:hypothetical protein
VGVGARSDLQHLLATCLHLLDLLPAQGCPSVTIVTDGVVTLLNEASLLDMAAHLRRRDVSLQMLFFETSAHTYAHVPGNKFSKVLCTGYIQLDVLNILGR